MKKLCLIAALFCSSALAMQNNETNKKNENSDDVAEVVCRRTTCTALFKMYSEKTINYEKAKLNWQKNRGEHDDISDYKYNPSIKSIKLNKNISKKEFEQCMKDCMLAWKQKPYTQPFFNLLFKD